MRFAIFLVVLLVAACDTPRTTSVSVPLCLPNVPCPVDTPPGDGYAIPVDAVACTPFGGSAVYDGDAWIFGSIATSLRCSVPLYVRLVDYPFDLEVVGSHTGSNSQVTACLQIEELFGVPGHIDLGPCRTESGSVGEFNVWIRQQQREDGSWFGINEDYALSVKITGVHAAITGFRLRNTQL